MAGGEQWTCFEADKPSGWDAADFESFASRQPWRFASSMPQNPHDYTLRRQAAPEDFERAVRYVREHGRMEQFWGKPYKVLYSGEYKYWTMGAPMADTILINRKRLPEPANGLPGGGGRGGRT